MSLFNEFQGSLDYFKATGALPNDDWCRLSDATRAAFDASAIR